MPEENRSYDTQAEELLGRLLVGYGDNYEISHHQTVGGEPIRAMAHYHLVEDKKLFGTGLKMGTSEANEYVLFVTWPGMGEAEVQKLDALLSAAEQELVKPHPGHGNSFLSILVLAGQVDGAVKKPLKKLRLRKEYPKGHGWCLSRLGVMDVNTAEMLTNNDGRDFKNAVQMALKRAAQA